MAGTQREELKQIPWLGKGQPIVQLSGAWAGVQEETFSFRFVEGAEPNVHWN